MSTEKNGSTGVELTLDQLAAHAEAGMSQRHVRQWALRVLRSGNYPWMTCDRVEHILTDVRTRCAWVPNVTTTTDETFRAPGQMVPTDVNTGDGAEFTFGDSDELAVQLAALLGSIGIQCQIVGCGYGEDKEITHAVVAYWDDDLEKWVDVDPSLRAPTRRIATRTIEPPGGRITKKRLDLQAYNRDMKQIEAASPLPIGVIPNHMGINLCAVSAIAWQERDDGQLVSLTIGFIPAEDDAVDGSAAAPTEHTTICCKQPHEASIEERYEHVVNSMRDVRWALRDIWRGIRRAHARIAKRRDDDEELPKDRGDSGPEADHARRELHLIGSGARALGLARVDQRLLPGLDLASRVLERVLLAAKAVEQSLRFLRGAGIVLEERRRDRFDEPRRVLCGEPT